MLHQSSKYVSMEINVLGLAKGTRMSVTNLNKSRLAL